MSQDVLLPSALPLFVMLYVVLVLQELGKTGWLRVLYFKHYLVSAISIAHVVQMKLQVAHTLVYSCGIEES